MPLDHDKLVPALMAKHGITLPRNAIEWRATLNEENLPPLGWMKGLNLRVRMLLTDGVVAWFMLGDSRLFFGHFLNFEPDVPEAKPRKPSKRALAMEED